MGGRDGGTKMYCPECKCIRVCSAINIGKILEQRGQRIYDGDHPDINWFRRGRECRTCYSTFVTAELDEKFLEELIQLRGILKEIRKNANEYQVQAESAAASLEKLTTSLEVLKALD